MASEPKQLSAAQRARLVLAADASKKWQTDTGGNEKLEFPLEAILTNWAIDGGDIWLLLEQLTSAVAQIESYTKNEEAFSGV